MNKKEDEYDTIIKKLESLSNPEAVKGMEKYRIKAKKAYGVPLPILRKIAKSLGSNHELANRFWTTNIQETRILASIIEDPNMVTEDQMEKWVKDFDSWEVCDQCCMNLFEKTKFAYQKAVDWSSRQEEFVKRAGFVLMARLAVSDKKAKDIRFEPFLSLILKEASDGRNFVKKAVNWALRQIGKRSQYLNAKAIETAEEIKKFDSGSALWIASDAIKELESEAVQIRLKKKI